jgi:hypothetical protein
LDAGRICVGRVVAHAANAARTPQSAKTPS